MALLMADPAYYAPDILGFYPQEREIDRRYEMLGINPAATQEGTRRAMTFLPFSAEKGASQQGSEALMQSLGSLRPAVPLFISEPLENMVALGGYGFGNPEGMTYDEMTERSGQAAMDMAGFGFGSRMFINPAYDPATVSMAGLSPAKKQRILKEVDRAKEFDPNAKGYYTKRQNKSLLTEMPVEREDLGLLLPRKSTSFEDYEGQYLVPAYGDRTATSQNILSYGDTILSSPSTQYGGYDYARNTGNAIWNTDTNKPKLYSRAEEAAQEGKDAYLTYLTMAGDSGDFNTMSVDLYFKSFDRMALSKEDAKIIDDHIKASQGGVKDWVGIQSEKLDEYLFKLPEMGEKRSKLMKRLDSKVMDEIGLPKVAEIRRALTAEELLNVPTFMGGNMIGRVDPYADISTVPNHPTYSDAGIIGGEYMGGVDVPIPDVILFRDVADRYMDEAGNFLANPRPDAKTPFFNRPNIKYTIDRQVPKQLVDEQMLREIEFYRNSLLGKY